MRRQYKTDSSCAQGCDLTKLNSRIDTLSRQMYTLESKVSSDMQKILSLLQPQDKPVHTTITISPEKMSNQMRSLTPTSEAPQRMFRRATSLHDQTGTPPMSTHQRSLDASRQPVVDDLLGVPISTSSPHQNLDFREPTNVGASSLASSYVSSTGGRGARSVCPSMPMTPDVEAEANRTSPPRSQSQPNDLTQGPNLRKCRSPLQGGASAASSSLIDPWGSLPRREDSRGSEPESWGDFKSLTEAPIARLESLDEMESLPTSP